MSDIFFYLTRRSFDIFTQIKFKKNNKSLI